MFSSSILRYDVVGDRIEPAYADARHAELVRSIVLRHQAFEGRPLRELERGLEEAPELRGQESRLVQGLRQVIGESMELAVETPIPPRRIRATVFDLARSLGDETPAEVRRRAAEMIGCSGVDIEDNLYADLPSERRVRFPRPIPSVCEIISRYNFRLVQGIVLRADRVRVLAEGNLRPIHRLAKLHGLIVEAKTEPAEGGRVLLEITGPMSLFRFTRRYGRALASFLPACTTASRYRLQARVVLAGRRLSLTVTEADRVLSPHGLPRKFDSKVEEQFCRDFIRLRSRWDMAREADMVLVDQTAFIPDFTFRLRDDPAVAVDMEIVGFWTRDYLSRKQLLLSKVHSRGLIVCVDDRLCCDRKPEPTGFLRYSRRVPAEEVLRMLDAHRR